ncbi:hypothetical protein [Hyphomonas sp.]|uniref:hypothetical protein n=1 Tax=Hyphomonas sp. TaxID=87 RepID=UPI00329A2E4C
MLEPFWVSFLLPLEFSTIAKQVVLGAVSFLSYVGDAVFDAACGETRRTLLELHFLVLFELRRCGPKHHLKTSKTRISVDFAAVQHGRTFWQQTGVRMGGFTFLHAVKISIVDL